MTVQARAGWHPDPDGPGLRYWDGAAWTDERRDPSTPEGRNAVLADAITKWIGMGYRVESQTDRQAVIVGGRRPNHLLHLVLSILTLGLWLIVWLIIAIGGGERRRTITVNDRGEVEVTKERRG